MARRFKRKEGLGAVSLPGVGGIGNDAVVEGDEYARFCPAVLDEVFEEAPVRGHTATAALVDEPSFMEPAPEPESEPVPESESDKASEPPGMGWRRDELAKYAERLGLEVGDKTKRQILTMIRSKGGK